MDKQENKPQTKSVSSVSKEYKNPLSFADR